MNKYRYVLLDGTTGEVVADYYRRVGAEVVFYVKEKGDKEDRDVYRIPGMWLADPIKKEKDKDSKEDDNSEKTNQ